MQTLKLSLPIDFVPQRLFGVNDELLNFLQMNFNASITLCDDSILVLKAPEQQIHSLARCIKCLCSRLDSQEHISLSELQSLYNSIRKTEQHLEQLNQDPILNYKGKSIKPQTLGQQKYVHALKNTTITFGIGPAGTGKTYLAVAYALSLLQAHKIGKIVLTRPVVEAGENLGFLPGTLEEKIDPYLRPLYDALHEMTDVRTLEQYLSDGVIEIAPLAFMRGRTFNDAVVILDEAQNTTPEQMKMFLTRLGFGSKFIITGDKSQNDLGAQTCTLQKVQQILHGIHDIAFCELDTCDVIRHSLVARIVHAYDNYAG